jgi:uncharacterized protein (DUF885 family)
MSWKTLNRILGLAAADQHFWQALQVNPLAAIRAEGFELTPEEQTILSESAAETLAEFSQYLLDTLAPDAQEEKSQKG